MSASPLCRGTARGRAALLACLLAGCGAENPPPPAAIGALGAEGGAVLGHPAHTSRSPAAAARVAMARADLDKLGAAGFHGRLFDADGEPAVGARVFLLAARPDARGAASRALQQAPLSEASVVEGGVFALPVEQGSASRYVVWALHPEHADWNAPLDAARGWIDLGVRRMSRGRTVRGSVTVLSSGAAAPDATVRMEAGGAELDAGLRCLPGREHGLVTRVLQDGSFELGPVPDSGTATLAAQAPGFRRLLRADFDLGAPEAEAHFQLRPGTELRGSVRRADGAALAGARIEAWPQDSDLPPLVTYADDDGAFEVAGLQPQRLHRVRVHAPGMRTLTRPDVAGGADELGFVMREAAVVVVDVRGQPLRAGAPARLALRRADAPDYAEVLARDVATTEDRSLRLTAPTSGTFVVTVEAPGGALAASAPFTVDEQTRSKRVEVDRAADAQLAGQLRSRGGALRDGLIVVTPSGASLAAAIQGPLRATSDAEGRFRVAGLAPGSYRVEARHPRACRAVLDEVQVTAGGDLVLAPLTLAEGAAVAGQLDERTGADEQAWIVVTPRSARAPAVRGDVAADGRFQLAESLPVGAFTARAYAHDRARAGKPRLLLVREFEVPPGQRAVTLQLARR